MILVSSDVTIYSRIDYMKPVLMVVALRRALVLTGSPGAKDKMGMTDVQFSRKRH